MKKEEKQVDLLLPERTRRPGVPNSPWRLLSFLKKYWSDILGVAVCYAGFTYAIGWVVSTAFFLFLAVLVWVVATEGR